MIYKYYPHTRTLCKSIALDLFPAQKTGIDRNSYTFPGQGVWQTSQDQLKGRGGSRTFSQRIHSYVVRHLCGPISTSGYRWRQGGREAALLFTGTCCPACHSASQVNKLHFKANKHRKQRIPRSATSTSSKQNGFWPHQHTHSWVLCVPRLLAPEPVNVIGRHRRKYFNNYQNSFCSGKCFH